jgi:pilus assembly protein CpaB
MNKSVLIIMGAAVAVAIVVAVFVSSSLGTKKVAEVKPTMEVLVANKILFKGDPLKAEDVHWQPWPEDVAFTGIIKKSEQADPEKLSVYGDPLRRNVESGEPVTTQSLVIDSKGSFLSAMIDPGMLAVSVAVQGEAGGAGGFISPGDRVDVILAYTLRLSGPAQAAAPKTIPKFVIQVLLRDIKVLAVDQNAKDDVHDPKIAKSVTLEVDVASAEKLALAQQVGSLSLALRRLGEKDDPTTVPPMITDVNSIDLVKKVNKYVEDDGPGYDTVRMYSGNAVENVPVRQTPEAPEAPQQQ